MEVDNIKPQVVLVVFPVGLGQFLRVFVLASGRLLILECKCRGSRFGRTLRRSTSCRGYFACWKSSSALSAHGLNVFSPFSHAGDARHSGEADLSNIAKSRTRPEGFSGAVDASARKPTDETQESDQVTCVEAPRMKMAQSPRSIKGQKDKRSRRLIDMQVRCRQEVSIQKFRTSASLPYAEPAAVQKVEMSIARLPLIHSAHVDGPMVV